MKRHLTFEETGAALRVEVDRIRAEVNHIVSGWLARVWRRRPPDKPERPASSEEKPA